MINIFLIHTVKSISYRFSRAVENSPIDFGDLKISKTSRTPSEIINHMYDLVNKSISIIEDGHMNIQGPQALDFEGEKTRFTYSLIDLIEVLSKHPIDEKSTKKILQGPFIDMATHVGQIAILKGIDGNNTEGESYFKVDLDK